MAELPTASETALLILDTVVHDLRVRVGETIGDQALRQAFQKRGGRLTDVAAGLKYASEQEEWLRYDTEKDVFLLTEEGLAAAPDDDDE